MNVLGEKPTSQLQNKPQSNPWNSGAARSRGLAGVLGVLTGTPWGGNPAGAEGPCLPVQMPPAEVLTFH